MMTGIDDNVFETLVKNAPGVKVASVVQPLAEEDFQRQKEKHISKGALGGAIGIVRTPDGKVALVKRSRLHAGWALPGGTVENGEGFSETFEREVMEEMGVALKNIQLWAIEKKRFVSPEKDEFDFLLAIFSAETSERQLPPKTQAAKDEGLKAALFDVSMLPEKMALTDRQKITGYLNKKRPLGLLS